MRPRCSGRCPHDIGHAGVCADGIDRTPPRTCPACRFADEAWKYPRPSDDVKDVAEFAYCMGAAHALAASHDNAVEFPFSLCPVHAAIVREAMDESVAERARPRVS